MKSQREFYYGSGDASVKNSDFAEDVKWVGNGP